MTLPDDFASQYRKLRIREGWAGLDGVEDPETGNPRLWSGRVKAVAEAAKVLSGLTSGSGKPLIIDVGAGGGWASRLLPGAIVVGVDLLPPAHFLRSFIRADMVRLPLRDHSVDGLLFAASLHYAPIAEVVRESARVLRTGGLIVAVDSPIYADSSAQAAAAARSQSYYSKSGFPALVASYHPIDARELRSALRRAGFELEVWKAEPSVLDRLQRRLGRPYTSTVVARLT